MRRTPSVLLQCSSVSLAVPLALPAWPKAAVAPVRQAARVTTLATEPRRPKPAAIPPRFAVDTFFMSGLPRMSTTQRTNPPASWREPEARLDEIGKAMLPEKGRTIHHRGRG